MGGGGDLCSPLFVCVRVCVLVSVKVFVSYLPPPLFFFHGGGGGGGELFCLWVAVFCRRQLHSKAEWLLPLVACLEDRCLFIISVS